MELKEQPREATLRLTQQLSGAEGVRLSARLGLVPDAQGLANTTSRCRRHGRFQRAGQSLADRSNRCRFTPWN